jgi:hypothetical protein
VHACHHRLMLCAGALAACLLLHLPHHGSARKVICKRDAISRQQHIIYRPPPKASQQAINNRVNNANHSCTTAAGAAGAHTCLGCSV